MGNKKLHDLVDKILEENQGSGKEEDEESEKLGPVDEWIKDQDFETTADIDVPDL